LGEGAPHADALLSVIIRAAEQSDWLVADATGWSIQLTDDQVAGATIWQLLIQDYPGYTDLIHAVGRFGLHLPDLIRGERNAQGLGLDRQLYARILQLIPGESGWNTLANALDQLIQTSLAQMPDNERLRLLEASTHGPELGERLCHTLDDDYCDYTYLSPANSARAELLQDHCPFIQTRQLADDDPSGLTSLDGAQLGWVILDSHDPDETYALLKALPQHMAPGGQVLLLGVHATAWLDLMLTATGELTGQSAAPLPDHGQITSWLQALGYQDIQTIELDDPDSGTYVIQARLAAAAATPAPERHSWLLVADTQDMTLATGLAERLASANQQVYFLEAGQQSVADLWTTAHQGDTHIDRILDLRGLGSVKLDTQMGRRCQLATDWAQLLEAQTFEPPPQLWLVTMGACALFKVPSNPQYQITNDAALWGFGRSLQNEAMGYDVRLLDFPQQSGLTTNTQTVLAALVAELCQPDDETEVLIDATGQRLVPRLRTVPAPGSAPSTASEQTTDAYHTLSLAQPGQLRLLHWTTRPMPELTADGVEVQVHATGLNFRDVMYALGMLSDEAIESGFSGPTMGLEFAGEVTRVGSGIRDFDIGDAVVGFGPASFSDRIIAPAETLGKVPAGIDTRPRPPSRPRFSRSTMPSNTWPSCSRASGC